MLDGPISHQICTCFVTGKPGRTICAVPHWLCSRLPVLEAGKARPTDVLLSDVLPRCQSSWSISAAFCRYTTSSSITSYWRRVIEDSNPITNNDNDTQCGGKRATTRGAQSAETLCCWCNNKYIGVEWADTGNKMTELLRATQCNKMQLKVLLLLSV